MDKEELVNSIDKILNRNREDLIKIINNEIDDNVSKSEIIVTNYWDIFDEGKTQIIVPNIQRNYVQGNNSNIKKKLIKDIFSVLKGERENINLDIVYGVNKNGKFIPIDGQQRLTTLFLLYWYIFAIENEYEKLKIIKITYENRNSSKEFFQMLTEIEKVEKILETSEEKTISERIKNSTYFYSSKWNKDVTIKAALNMLDEIEKQYKKCKNHHISDILTKENTKDKIFFNCKYLYDSKSDIAVEELYIKMNSRGKKLSDYEILKSQLESIAFKIMNNEEYIKLCSNLDNKWANLFLKCRDNKEIDQNKIYEYLKEVENDYYKFLKAFLTYQFMENVLDVNNYDEKNEFKNNLEKGLEIEFEKEGIYFLDHEFYGKLENVMNNLEFLYSNNPYNNCINMIEILNLEELWQNIMKKEYVTENNLEESLYFYAIIKYLENNYSKEYITNNYEYFENWIRVTRNFIKSINHIQIKDERKKESVYFQIVRTINKLAQKLKEYPNIIVYIENANGLELGVQEDSIWLETEKKKSHYMLTSDNWKNAILMADKDTYFLGRNYFLFEYIKEINDDKEKLNTFKIYQQISQKIFKNSVKANNNHNTENQFLIQRAMLTKENYFKELEYNIKTFLIEKNADNTNTWLSELNVPNSEIRNRLKVFIDKEILKIDTNCLNTNITEKLLERIEKINIDQELEKLIYNYLSNSENIGNSWRYYFIMDPKLFNEAKGGNIKFIDDNNSNKEVEDRKERKISIIRTRRNSKYWDYLTYFLRNKLIEAIGEEQIEYKGKIGDDNFFTYENTLKVKYNDMEYCFIRNEEGKYNICLKNENNIEYFCSNFDITSNGKELDKNEEFNITNRIFNSGNITIKRL